MFTREEAKDYLIIHFNKCIEAHKSGNYHSINNGFDHYDRNLPRDDAEFDDVFHLSVHFWDGWVDSANHEWRHYEPITICDWPILAQNIIDILNDKEIDYHPLLIRVFISLENNNKSGCSRDAFALFFFFIILVIINSFIFW